MSIGKIGSNIYNIYPDSIKKDSERKLSQVSGNEIKVKKTINENSQPVHHTDKNYSADKILKDIHNTDEVIEDYISHVKSQNLSVNKFYPPYPPGSEDKIKLLKKFLLFREQIARFSLEQNNIEKVNIPEENRIQELEAEIKSMEIRKSLIESSSYSITSNQKELLGLV